MDASADGGGDPSDGGAERDAAQADAGERDASSGAGMDGSVPHADAGDHDASAAPADGGLDAGGDASADSGLDASADAATDAGVDAAAPGFEAHRTGTDRIPADVLAELQAAASGTPPKCDGLTLYPYRDAVFPRGRRAPVVAWASAGSALYLRARFQGRSNVDYELAQSGAELTDLPIPQADWDALSQAGSGKLALMLAKRGAQGAQACELPIEIAPAALSGDVFYSSYNFPQSLAVAAVLRLPLESTSPGLFLYEPTATAPMGPCISCHTVSAGGTRLIAAKHLYFPASFTASSYPAPAVQPSAIADVSNPFAALTPDGAFALQMGNPDCTQGANAFPRAARNFPQLVGPTVARLVDTKTGNVAVSTGLDPARFMWMPQFSSDGRHVVFNDARPDGNGGTERGELGIADFDPRTRTFSNLRTLVSRAAINARISAPTGLDYAPFPLDLASFGGFLTPVPGNDNCTNGWAGDPSHVGRIQGGSSSGPRYPAWPTFTPDGKGVVFSLVSEPDFAISLPGRSGPAKGELWYVDVASGELVRLDAANAGVGGDETQRNFYPSFLPTSYGGYQWLFFTAMRRVGNDTLEAPASNLGDGTGATPSRFSYTKRIWVSAISPRGVGALSDLSHPPFFLAEQSDTINTRPVAVSRAP